MQKKLFILSFLICLIGLVISCKDNMTSDINVPTENIATGKRVDFLKGKSIDEQKAQYRALSEDARKELWIDKLSQIQSLPLPDNQRTLIKALELTISKSEASFSFQNQEMKNVALELASIMPRVDFLRMFVLLDDYKPSTSSDKGICSECIKDLQNEDGRAKNFLEVRAGGGACNCKWTCSSGGGCGTKNCDPHSLGCGWFWLQSCKEKATMDCP